MIDRPEPVRKAINITIRSDLKDRYDYFVAWLKRYHAGEGDWTQNTAMDEVLADSELWVEYLVKEVHNHEHGL